jgi:GntR family transcriptional repressor for pyruvate dehydrogenase complex
MKRTAAQDSIFRTLGYKEGLVDRVVDEIQHMIIEGTLEAGMKLPGERELADQVGVSRTVIREAIKTLHAKGLIDLRQGVGTFVRAINGEQISGPLTMLLRTNGITLENLHQVRIILEVEIARVAASEATGAEIARLQELLTESERVMDDPGAFAEGDAAFHHALAEFSHNPLLVMLLDSIGGLMRDVRISVSKYPDLFRLIVPDHREILESVKAKDPSRAQQAMRHHLENARKIQELYLRDREAKGEHAGA